MILQNPIYPLPSSTTIRRRLDKQTRLFENNALSRLPLEAKVVLSLDYWSSSTRLSFIGIIVHYISKDWELVKELVGFENLIDVYIGVILT